MRRDLGRVLRPQSIAVLGAGWAANVVEQCGRMGFTGPVWPVHPTRGSVAGVPTFRSLADLPHAPDAVFIGVNRHATVGVVSELAKMNAGGAICFAAGWAEAGAPELQAALVAAAGDMPILGPNCYGVINYLDGALLWPDQHGGRRVERGVALLSQSSNVIVNLSMQTRGLPVAYVACLGNAAQVGLTDLGSALLADDRVTALGLYVEGIADAPAFAALAEAARAAGKGIVCIKAGKTEASRSAAASHTASLAGGGAASSAFLRQIGVAEVETPSQLLETLKIFHAVGPQIGTRLCSLSCSGGEAGLVADLAAPLGLDLPPPPGDTASRLSELLGPLVAVANPLDYNTFIWGDEARTSDVFATMLAAYDAGMFVIDVPREDRCDPSSYVPSLNAMATSAARTGRPAFAVASMPEGFGEARAEAIGAQGVVPLQGLETALAAIRAAQTGPGRAGWRPLGGRRAQGAVRMLDEGDAKAVLVRAGIVVPRGVSAATLADLVVAAAGLTAPYALKGLGFAHKTEAGAVRLGLTTLVGQPDMPGATGYLAEEMVTGVVAEVLLGLRRDPVYGVTMTLGLGGVAAELLADTVTLIAPVNFDEIAAALRRLRLWPLLDGYRGRARADTAALIEAALACQALMLASRRIQEIEINPLMLRTRGAVAVDAVIWEEEE